MNDGFIRSMRARRPLTGLPLNLGGGGGFFWSRQVARRTWLRLSEAAWIRGLPAGLTCGLHCTEKSCLQRSVGGSWTPLDACSDKVRDLKRPRLGFTESDPRANVYDDPNTVWTGGRRHGVLNRLRQFSTDIAAYSE